MEERHYSNHGAVRNEVKPGGHRRAWSHDYCEVGTYMVTMVTVSRARVFGRIEGSAVATKKVNKEAWARDMEVPHIVLSELGRRVLEEEVPKISHFYPQVEVWRVAMMPDHIHILIRVKERLPDGKHLGTIIRGFKTGCTRAWWALQDAGVNPAANAQRQPSGKTLGTIATMTESTMAATAEGTAAEMPAVTMVAMAEGTTAAMPTAPTSPMAAVSTPLPTAVVPEAFPSGCPVMRPVLFEAGYHDSIINRPGMLDSIKRYMLENPLRARIREECPRLMERRLHLWIAGREYAAFGNLFLLKYPMKQQVFFHRFTQVSKEERENILRANQPASPPNQPPSTPSPLLTPKELERMSRDTRVAPTHLTAWYADEKSRLLREAEEGTILVTPGISRGESIIANAAVEAGLPLILLQSEIITPLWKPSERRFFACAEGRMLILSPWQLDDTTDYDSFHRLNDFAKEICEATEMRICDYGQLRTLVK